MFVKLLPPLEFDLVGFLLCGVVWACSCVFKYVYVLHRRTWKNISFGKSYIPKHWSTLSIFETAYPIRHCRGLGAQSFGLQCNIEFANMLYYLRMFSDRFSFYIYTFILAYTCNITGVVSFCFMLLAIPKTHFQVFSDIAMSVRVCVWDIFRNIYTYLWFVLCISICIY